MKVFITASCKLHFLRCKRRFGNIDLRNTNTIRQACSLVANFQRRLYQKKSAECVRYVLRYLDQTTRTFSDKIKKFHATVTFVQGFWRQQVEKSRERLASLIETAWEEYETMCLFYRVQKREKKDKNLRRTGIYMLALLED